MPILHFSRSGISKLVSRINLSKSDRPRNGAARVFEFPRGRWLVIFAIISAAYTANVVQWSLRFGRLAMDPVFDDVGYLIDGLQRLNVLDSVGVHAFCQTFVQSPPHSPWSTLLAVIAFALFGVNDWAPYLLNGLLVFFLLCLAWDVAGQTTFARMAITSVVFLSQLPFQAILEFRPDFAAALFTAGFTVLLLKMGIHGMERTVELRAYFCVGLLVGLAYLTKPSFFPHTTVMLFAALFVSEINRGLLARGRLEILGIIRRSLLVLAGAVLVAGPYFGVNWRTVLGYFSVNTGSGKEASIWREPGGFWGSLAERLHGYSVSITLGRFTNLFAIWLLVGVAIALVHRNYRAVLFSVSGILLSATSLLLIAAGQMGDPHFSYTWLILFVLTTLCAVGEITKDRKTAFLALVFCFMSFFTFYKAPPPRNLWQVIKDTARDESMNKVIVERIAARAATDLGARRAIVYSTFMGKVNAASQNWLAIKEDLNAAFRDLHRSGDIAEHLAAIRAADFVEVADSRSAWLDRWLPSAPLQDALLQNLRNLSTFRELPPVLGKEGTVFLFEKRPDL
jgi:sulfur transfer complex TusBCD TusB component (DsrH family)